MDMSFEVHREKNSCSELENGFSKKKKKLNERKSKNSPLHLSVSAYL